MGICGLGCLVMFRVVSEGREVSDSLFVIAWLVKYSLLVMYSMQRVCG